MTLDDIPEDLLLDCASLVKANSIAGCKKHSVYVVYTRWKNLKKTAQMVDGQVSYHRPENVRRTQVEKNNPIVKEITKTKEERHPNLAQIQQDRLREVQLEKKAQRKREEKEKVLAALEEKQRQEELSYDRLMTQDNMTNVADVEGTADSSAAEAYEDDFFWTCIQYTLGYFIRYG